MIDFRDYNNIKETASSSDGMTVIKTPIGKLLVIDGDKRITVKLMITDDNGDFSGWEWFDKGFTEEQFDKFLKSIDI